MVSSRHILRLHKQSKCWKLCKCTMIFQDKLTDSVAPLLMWWNAVYKPWSEQTEHLKVLLLYLGGCSSAAPHQPADVTDVLNHVKSQRITRIWEAQLQHKWRPLSRTVCIHTEEETSGFRRAGTWEKELLWSVHLWNVSPLLQVWHLGCSQCGSSCIHHSCGGAKGNSVMLLRSPRDDRWGSFRAAL